MAPSPLAIERSGQQPPANPRAPGTEKQFLGYDTPFSGGSPGPSRRPEISRHLLVHSDLRSLRQTELDH